LPFWRCPLHRRICAALSDLTGQAQPYDPAADEATRAKTIAAWKDWWAKHSSKVESSK
jgi:hypothetical protein